MRARWVWPLFLLFLLVAVTTPAAPSLETSSRIALVTISPEMRAAMSRDYELEVVVTSHRGDAWTRLARRVTGDAARWEELAEYNGGDDNLRSEQLVRVPFVMVRPELQRQIIETLFPTDRLTAEGWRHTVVGSAGIEGESLWKIAEWFTGDGANYTRIRKANPTQRLSTRKGDVIVVPRQLLTAAFRGNVMEGEHAQKAAEARKLQDDPVERTSTHDHVAEATLPIRSSLASQPSLTYERGASEPYAVYRLQKGEALWSSVAIRFTGRVYAKDVGDVLDRLVKFNGIEDVSRMPAGYRVKIPMDLLLPEYLPANDPQRVALEASLRESEMVARRTRAKGLTGVHIILDAGHGGRDPGTTHDELWESSYVYDVTCRLKRMLEKKSGATVSLTTKSARGAYRVPDTDVLPSITDQVVLTTPRYDLDDPTIGVNLRWYLANSIFHRAMSRNVPKEKVLFLSIHADSLHPSIRGAMVYIPGQRFIEGSYEKKGPVYLARAEVRERPVVRHSREDALQASGLSRELAESLVSAFDDAKLAVHPFNPVRDNVVRNGREWVPAVIRHNMVPTRALLEVCNLGNVRDRELLTTRKYREQLAEAIYRGIERFYAGREEDDSRGGTTVMARGAAK